MTKGQTNCHVFPRLFDWLSFNVTKGQTNCHVLTDVTVGLSLCHIPARMMIDLGIPVRRSICLMDKPWLLRILRHLSLFVLSIF